MRGLSIVTCVSDPSIYQQCLLDSVQQTRNSFAIDIIPVINSNGAYSASTALNVGVAASKNDLVICAHQDVRLMPGWFSRLYDLIDELGDNWAVLGVAGISLEAGITDIGRWGGTLDKTIAVGTVFDDQVSTEPYWDGLQPPTLVHCLDECLFVINKQADLSFDTRFNGFHFYGTDLCLQARDAKLEVYAAGLPIIHDGKYSTSMSGNSKYWTYFRILYNKWSGRFPELLGTHFHWATETVRGKQRMALTNYHGMTLESDLTPITIKAVTLNSLVPVPK